MKIYKKIITIILASMCLFCLNCLALAASNISIIQQPKDCCVKSGKTASFYVKAEGEGITYQWQYKAATSNIWRNCTSVSSNTDTFAFKMSSNLDGRYYRCVITDGQGSKAESNAALLTEKKAAITITSQPESCSVKSGDTVRFHVEAEGNDLSYQWQYRISSSSSWRNCSSAGSNTDTFTFKMSSSMSSRQYRCVITDADGMFVESDAALLSEKLPQIKIISQPESCSVKSGNTVTFHIEAEGENLTYQWQYRLSSSSSWRNCTAKGYNTDTFTFKMTSTMSGRQYRCVISDEDGMFVESDAAMLSEKVCQITIISQPESCSVKEGEQVRFHVEAEGEGLTNQWQYRTSSSGSWKNCSSKGYNTDTFSFKATATMFGRQYRCLLTDEEKCQVYTNIVDLTLAGCTSHTWLDGICTTCDLECEHKNLTYIGFNNGIHYAFCRECNTEGEDLPCVDTDNDGICDLCDASMPAACNHSWVDGICSECGVECTHENLNQNGKCDTCGAVAFR